MTRRGYTLMEVITAAVIATVMAGFAFGAWRTLFNPDSRHSITGLTRASFSQKDARAGVRRLLYRLREGIQILEPPPGKSGPALMFRDVTNKDVRVRLDADARRVISEVRSRTGWTREDRPIEVDVAGTKLAASWPIQMLNCTALSFTVLSPECVAVEATVEADGQPRLVMTVVKLRNSNLAF
jgi:prepilin-type N-terminal cleavage/methylation domain-containing protein